MNVFLILAHPEQSSFCAALHETAKSTLLSQGHQVLESNLYLQNFDPVSDRRNFNTVADPNYFKQQAEEKYATENNGFSADIKNEMDKLQNADIMIWHFPLWWFGIPAILKGWVDKVFAAGWAYGGGRMFEAGVFSDKKAMVSFTTGGSDEAYLPGGYLGNMDRILKPIHRGIFQFVGLKVLKENIIHSPSGMSFQQRELALKNYEKRILGLGEEQSIQITDY